MRSLVEPTIDDEQAYDQIVAAKRPPNRARLVQCRAQVLQAYAHYQANAPNFEMIVPPIVTEATKSALHHGFNSVTQPLNEIRDALILPIAAVRCPFCGISEASTLDHYLPKELHPLYSVYSRNLVPCCAKCNSRKSTKIVLEDVGVRRFFHPYYDTIPVEPFLGVTVTLSPTHFVVDYNLVQPQSMSDPVFTQLESHYHELDLEVRYRSNALHRLTEDRHAIRRHFLKDQTGGVLSEELVGSADGQEKEHGPNDWLAVLYRELSQHDDFVGGGFEALFAIQ